MEAKREFSAGGVVYKKLKAQTFVPSSGRGSAKLKTLWLVGKHSGYHKWVLPKGLIEKGEHGWETALREVEEEMGVKARLVSEKPIHRVSYMYWADFKQKSEDRSQKTEDTVDIMGYGQSDEVRMKRSGTMRSLTRRAPDGTRRRVGKYQEEGGGKTKVFKVVSFYLMEYESGDPKDHDWEMEEAGWFPYEEAMQKLAFAGEREALTKGNQRIQQE